MVIKKFKDMIAPLQGAPKRTVVLVGGDEVHSLEATLNAKDIVNHILVGDRSKVEAALRSLGEDPKAHPIVEVPDGMHPAVCAANLIHEGRADFIMKGNITTGDLLKGSLSKEANLRDGDNLMSHFGFLEVPGWPKLLGVTDAAMIPSPDFDQKVGILKNALHLLYRLGYKKPNVACICPSEAVSPKIQSTVDAAKIKEMSLNGQLPPCNVEGPISYDLAVQPGIAKEKGYDSPYVCDFDLALVPELTTGNVLAKCLVYPGGGGMAGLILGCKVPIVMISRGSSTDEKYYSLAMGASMYL
jgi:phosphate butyryltransferase